MYHDMALIVRLICEKKITQNDIARCFGGFR